MPDIDQVADKAWPKHVLTSEELRQANIEKWKKAVAYLGYRWVALSMNHRTHRQGA